MHGRDKPLLVPLLARLLSFMVLILLYLKTKV
jgi:hypothetical protein